MLNNSYDPLAPKLFKPIVVDTSDYVIIGESHGDFVRPKYKGKVSDTFRGIKVGVLEGELSQFLEHYRNDSSLRKTARGMLYLYCKSKGVPMRSMEKSSGEFVPLLKKYGASERCIKTLGLSITLEALSEIGRLSGYNTRLFFEQAGFTDIQDAVPLLSSFYSSLIRKGVANTETVIEFVLDNFTFPFLYWAMDIREKEIWEPRINEVISQFPPKRAFVVGRKHVGSVEKILKGELPRPPDWQKFKESLTEDKKFVFDELERLSASL